MNNTEADQLLQAILDKVEAEPSEFRFIESWVDFVICHRNYRANKIIINVLNKASNQLFTDYCKTVTPGISDVTQLMAFSQLPDIIDVYKKELSTLDDMLNDYEDYLWNGNFFYSFFGGERF